MKIKKNDTVKVRSGKDKGKTGTVLEVLPAQEMVRVEGVGTVKRHVKPNSTNKHPQGGIVEHQALIPISKVMLVLPQTGEPVRVGYRINEDGKKVRVARGKRGKQQVID